MNWLNLNVQTLDSEEFIGSEPIDRATWLCLQRFCIGQENGGVIEDCLDWADRKWQMLVRITRKEAKRECALWKWDGNSLKVWGYPCEKETEVRQKRDNAKTNGSKGGRPKKTEVGTEEKPTLVISAKAEGERKGKEGEREGNTPLPPKGETDVSDFDEDEEPPSPKPTFEEQAQTIVDAYPRRERFANAIQIVAQQLKAGGDFEEILRGTKAAAEAIKSAPSAKANRYTPNAEKFFRDMRWMDDPATIIRPPENSEHKPNGSSAPAVVIGGRTYKQ